MVTVHFLTKELEERSEGQENQAGVLGGWGCAGFWRGFCHRMQNAGLAPSRQRQRFSLRANNQERDFSPILVFCAESYALRFGLLLSFSFSSDSFKLAIRLGNSKRVSTQPWQ